MNKKKYNNLIEIIMYYLQSEKSGKIVPMNNRWIRDFKKIMWNEGEKVVFDNDNTKTTIKTLAGNYQGQRIWKYWIDDLQYNEIDYGIINLVDYNKDCV